MRVWSPLVANELGEGRRSYANSTWRDARFHSDVLIWPCKAECGVARAGATHASRARA